MNNVLHFLVLILLLSGCTEVVTVVWQLEDQEAYVYHPMVLGRYLVEHGDSLLGDSLGRKLLRELNLRRWARWAGRYQETISSRIGLKKNSPLSQTALNSTKSQTLKYEIGCR